MRAVDINNLMFNPIWTSKLLFHFISGASDTKSGKLKFELIYLALPFLFDEVVFEKLINCNKNSSFTTLFSSVDLKYRLILIDNRIEAFKRITNQGLIYLGNKHELIIDEHIQIKDRLHYNLEKDSLKKQSFKAAYNLGLILAKEDYRNVFVKLEIIEI